MPLDRINPREFEGNEYVRDACAILVSGYRTTGSFLDVYLEQRQGQVGNSTDAQQDQLRAMVLFSASTLDAVVKQLIRDALALVIEKDEGAQLQLESFVERRIKRNDKGETDVTRTGGTDIRFISQVIASANPRKVLVESLVDDLTGDSLQSRDQVLRVAAYFAITREEIFDDFELVGTIFRVRNQIAHEMDIDLDQNNRSRRQRRRNDMEQYANTLLAIALKFLRMVSAKTR